jgi:hypothetical protein
MLDGRMGRLLVVIAACLAALPAWAQERSAPPKTSFGAPSLEGMWSTLTATPLERPAAFTGLTTTEERAAAFTTAGVDAFSSDTSDGVGGRQSEWWEFGGGMTRINGEIRTSLIVDPPDGKMPLSDAGRAKLRQHQAAVLGDFDNPETRPSPERCLTGGSGATGAPLFVPRYNANYHIVQTPDHVVIQMEQNREVRIIRIGDAHQPDVMRRWMGDSIGRWEGDTLVVETRGFVPGDAFKPASPIIVGHNATVTERFTRITQDEILYRFSVDDAETFSQPWTVEMILSATDDPIFEYACHEANHSLPGILAGGRLAERLKN